MHYNGYIRKRGGTEMGQVQRRERQNTRSQDIEVWDFSRDSDGPRMMRLADPESRQPDRRRHNHRPRPVRQETDNRRQRPARRETDNNRPRPVRREAAGSRPRPVRQETDSNRQRPARRETDGNRPRPVRRETVDCGLARPVERRPRPVQPIRYTERVEENEVRRVRSARAVRRRRAKRRNELLCKCFTLIVVAVCLVLIYQTTGAVYHMVHDQKEDRNVEKNKGIVEVVSEKLGGDKIEAPAITEDFLEVNDYSRPGTKLNKVKSVFVHYTANPGTSAQQNRSYFANLAETHERSASAHFIIGYDGELVQCIPLEEQAYAVATRNEDSISIECCYQDEEGKFTQETYDTLVHMLAWLTQEYHLSTDDILRHYDCGGKKCPLYYVEHEDAWEQLLADVESYKSENTQ